MDDIKTYRMGIGFSRAKDYYEIPIEDSKGQYLKKEEVKELLRQLGARCPHCLDKWQKVDNFLQKD